MCLLRMKVLGLPLLSMRPSSNHPMYFLRHLSSGPMGLHFAEQSLAYLGADSKKKKRKKNEYDLAHVVPRPSLPRSKLPFS
eukprot:11989_6